MATVHLARVEAGQGYRHVALKLLHPHLKEQPEQVEQILHEARVAALVRHPNVVQVFDVGEDPAGAYLVMHYVEGEVLSELMRGAERKKTRLPRRVALRIILDVLAGLHAAHEVVDEEGHALDLVHRDVSPQNILVGIDGVARLTDFGIAKVATRHGVTRAGVVKGKASYMSPEQARARPIDRRSDVFAAAVVAWELLAGRAMHPPGREAAVMSRIISEDAPRLATVVPGMDPDLDAAVAAALVREPLERTPSALAFREALVAAAAGEVAEAQEVAAYVTSAAAAAILQRHERMLAATGDDTTTPLISLRELRVAPSVDPAVEYDPTGPGEPRFLAPSVPPPPSRAAPSRAAAVAPAPVSRGSPTVTWVVLVASVVLAATTVGLYRLLLAR